MSSLYIRYVICKSFLSFHKLPYHLLMISLPWRNFLVWYSLSSFLVWGWGGIAPFSVKFKKHYQNWGKGAYICIVQAYILLQLFALLRFADISVSYRLKVCGKTGLSKSIKTIFRTAFAHFVSLCYILVILEIFQKCSSFLYSICYGDMYCMMLIY